MAWAEVRGSRQVQDGPLSKEFRVTFEGLWADAAPSLGQNIGDVQSGATALSSTGLTREPYIVSVGHATKITATKSRVTCVFRAPKSEE